MHRTLLLALAASLTAAAGMALGQSSKRVYEIRTYTAVDGKLNDLHARFRNHTMRLFEKHGMKNIGYWTPSDERAKNTLIYIVSHKDRDAAKKSWDAFRADPEWIKARDASEANGKIVQKVESVFLESTDYSPLN